MFSCRFVASSGFRVRSPTIVSRHGSQAVLQCVDENAKSLAGRDGADRQEMRHVVWMTCDLRCWIVSGPCHGNSCGRYAVTGGDKFCCGGAGHHDFAHLCQRRAFTDAKRTGAPGRQAALERQAMMHQRDQRMLARKFGRDIREDTERQAIQYDRLSG